MGKHISSAIGFDNVRFFCIVSDIGDHEMSDGPFKSLPMRPKWKQAAKLADMEASSKEEVDRAVSDALSRDWDSEVPKGFLPKIQGILNDPQGGLFGLGATERLEALKMEPHQGPMSGVLLDLVIQKTTEGRCDQAVLKEATEETLQDRTARCARQVKEHYLMNRYPLDACRVSERIENSSGKESLSALCDSLLSPKQTTTPVGFVKKSGIDDGISLE